MNRVPEQRYATAIERAYSYIPEPLRARLQRVDFLCGVGAPFAGFGSWDNPNLAAAGLSYDDCAYYIDVENGARITRAHRKPTICLPHPHMAYPALIVHELGHALHDQLGWRPEVQPVTWYAKTNRHEAFAEAFTAWVAAAGPVDVGFGHYREADYTAPLRGTDPGAQEVFDRLL